VTPAGRPPCSRVPRRQAFVAYRRRQGSKGPALPDFYIGAHAAVTGLSLLTRHAARFRTYFPTVPLMAPAR
jgi:predicted nucleic acid-binding protein